MSRRQITGLWFVCVWIFICLAYIGRDQGWPWWQYVIAGIGMLGLGSMLTPIRGEKR